MSLFRKTPVIAVHSGKFHADDLFAAAMLLEFLKGKARVIRTTDPVKLAKADFVLDVGRVYDPSKNRFDHHQGDAGVRPNGVPYAASGLVWKHFGERIAGDIETAEMVDRKLIAQMDVTDTGFASPKPLAEDVYPYLMDTLVGAFSSTWLESDDSLDESFMSLLPFARRLLAREIAQAKAKLAARSLVQKAYDESSDKRLIVLDKALPLNSLEEKPEVLFVVSPEPRSGGWCVRTVRKDKEGFANRKDLPKGWAGTSDEAMAQASGVSDATFCHLGLFLAVAKSREGALALAEKALAY